MDQNLKHLVESMPLRPEIVLRVSWVLSRTSTVFWRWPVSTYVNIWRCQINIKTLNTLTNLTMRQYSNGNCNNELTPLGLSEVVMRTLGFTSLLKYAENSSVPSSKVTCGHEHVHYVTNMELPHTIVFTHIHLWRHIHTSSSSGSTVVSSYTLWFSMVFGTSFGGACMFV